MDDWLPPDSEDECILAPSADGGVPQAASSLSGGVPQAASSSIGDVLQAASSANGDVPQAAASSNGGGHERTTSSSTGGVPQTATSKQKAAAKKKQGKKGTLFKPPKGRNTHPVGATPRKRKLKKCVSETRPVEVEATSMVCVWGGHMKRPVVVEPVWIESGTTWMSPSEHWLWLRRSCCDKGMTFYKQKFQNALSALRLELKQQLNAHNTPDPAGQLRATLNLDSDDEAKAACPQRRLATRTGIVTVKLGDTVIKMQNKPRPLAMECTESSVIAVMKFCRLHIRSDQASAKQDRAVAKVKQGKPSFAMPAEDCPAIVGKVTWQPSHQAWCIHGKSDTGEVFTNRVKVVESGSSSGFLKKSVPTKEAFLSLRRKRYIDAMNSWNELDRSSRPRIDVPLE